VALKPGTEPAPIDGVARETSTHLATLRPYAIALAGNPVDAEDLIQETFKRALVSTRNGSRVRDARPYLHTVLRNVRWDQLRYERACVQVVPLADAEAQLVAPPTQHQHLEYRELCDAIRHLPEEQREVLLLVCFQDRSYRAAAALLDIPVGTVMSRLYRARESLRRLVQGRNVTEDGDGLDASA
jgi:RNA polymerase sigma-70 factor, ECF subfamily